MKTYKTRDQYDIVFLLTLQKLGRISLEDYSRNEYGQLEVEFSPRDYCESAIDQMFEGKADLIQPKLIIDSFREFRKMLKGTYGRGNTAFTAGDN